MRVLVEGPRWAGMWTEAVADAIAEIGHEHGVHYHNARGLLASISNRAWRVSAHRSWLPTVGAGHAERSNRALDARLAAGDWDVLISIQGKLDAALLDRARRANPRLRTIFWWGDILTERGARRIAELAPAVDRVLVSYRGDRERLRAAGHRNVDLFLFGVSPRYHQVLDSPGVDRHDVVLVGTCYPERCEAVRALDRRLRQPVAVWGRSWRRCPQVRASRAVRLAEAQALQARARIALNVHHRDTRDGVNMKYFEIPAAGGFQIVDHQPLMDEPLGDRGVVSYRSTTELCDLVEHYLAHEDERAERAALSQRRVLEADRYAPRLARLLEQV